MISFSTGKLRKKNYFEPIILQLLKRRRIRGENWGNKLVKLSDEFVTKYECYFKKSVSSSPIISLLCLRVLVFPVHNSNFDVTTGIVHQSCIDFNEQDAHSKC